MRHWSRSYVYATLARDHLYFVTHGAGTTPTHWVSVVAQSPAPGAVVADLSQVSLTVSLVPAHNPRPVPSVTGRGWARALATLRSAGFDPAGRAPRATPQHWVGVVGQRPAAGTIENWGAVVTVIARDIAQTTTTTTSSTTTTTLTSASTTTLPGDSTTTSSTTTTVVHVTTTTTSSHERTGVATWYSYIPGRCADWYSPMGTRLHIESLVTHRIITCVVTDREAAHGNRVVDLSETQFAQLAPLAKGVTPVRVWWP